MRLVPQITNENSTNPKRKHIFKTFIQGGYPHPPFVIFIFRNTNKQYKMTQNENTRSLYYKHVASKT